MNYRVSKKEFVEDEEEKIDTHWPPLKKAHNSIASFLKESLKSMPAQNKLIDFDTHSLSKFTSKQNDSWKIPEISKKSIKVILEEEKEMDGLDNDFEDLDDMDLDNLPEPSLV